MHHGDGNGLFAARHDGLDHLRIAEGRHIALLLQLEALVGNAVGGVDGEDELEIDRIVGRPCGGQEQSGQQDSQHPSHAALQPVGQSGAERRRHILFVRGTVARVYSVNI